VETGVQEEKSSAVIAFEKMLKNERLFDLVE
jgi:hypothetical protein